jgi:hypothetical protein
MASGSKTRSKTLDDKEGGLWAALSVVIKD